MSVVLDTGALLAIERGERSLTLYVEDQLSAGEVVRTHGGVVAQAWRGGGRQVRLARALRSVDVIAVGRVLGKEAGALLAESKTSDVVDAALVCIADDGDTIVTSDPDDIAHLIVAAGADVDIRAV